MKKFEYILGYPVVILCFIGAVAVLLPRTSQEWTSASTTYNYTYDFREFKQMSWDELIAELNRRNAEIARVGNQISVQQVQENLVFLNWVRDYGPQDGGLQGLCRQFGMFNDAARRNTPNKQFEWELSAIQDRDPRWIAIRHPTETVIHWDQIRRLAANRAVPSLLLVLVGLIGLLRLWGLTKFVYVGGCTISFLLSVTGGAIAQTIKKAADAKQRKGEQTLQIDARASVYVADDPPNPGLYLRGTYRHPKLLAESVNTWNPGNGVWTTEVAAGPWIHNGPKFKLMLASVFAQSNTAPARVGLGLEVFRSGNNWLFAMPHLRFERAIHGPPKPSFSMNVNPWIKLSPHWAIAPDVTVRKTRGVPVRYLAGVGIRFLPHTRVGVEEGYLRDEKGTSVLRSRFITTLPLHAF